MTTRQPNSRHCFVCGVENPFGLHLTFYETDEGEIETTYTVEEKFQGYPGVVHGGIVAAMLDEVAGRSFMGSDPPRFMYTARLDIRYRKNVPIGVPLRLVGKPGKSRGRTAQASAFLYSFDGDLLAQADALLVNVPQGVVEGTSLDALGWRVYSDEELQEVQA